MLGGRGSLRYLSVLAKLNHSDILPHYSGDQIKKSGMVGACSVYGGIEGCI